MRKPKTTKELLNLIHSTLPIEVNQSISGVEIHSLTSRDHILLYLWSIKSFIWQSGTQPRVVVHDDGSLTDKDAELLTTHLPGIQVIPQHLADSEVVPTLKQYPNSQRYREQQPFAKKIFDVFHYAKSDKIMILDSDVLFFKKPIQICDWINDKEALTVLYNYDPFDLDKKKRPIITAGLSVEYPLGYNSGLQCLPRNFLNYELAEKYFEFSYLNNIIEWVSEQRCMSIMASQHKHSELPRNEYFFQNKRDVFYRNRNINNFPSSLVAKHYSRYARKLFAKEGIAQKYNPKFNSIYMQRLTNPDIDL